MTLNKLTIAHIVSELLVVSAVAFYFHKKYIALQTQVQELVAKIEKLNLERVPIVCQKQEQFEAQITQQINKIWNVLNSSMPAMYPREFNQRPEFNQRQEFNQRPVFVPQYNVDSSKQESVRENYANSNSNKETKKETSQNENTKPKEAKPFNPIQSALSMIGPLSTMFQLTTDRKTPHPEEIFQNVNIGAVLQNQKQQTSSAKIVEVEDDPSNSDELLDEKLDEELQEELKELCTPIVSASRFDNRSVQRFTDSIAIVTVTQQSADPAVEVANSRSASRFSNDALELTNQEQSETPSSQSSSPLRFINASEQKKPGRRKRVSPKSE